MELKGWSIWKALNKYSLEGAAWSLTVDLLSHPHVHGISLLSTLTHPRYSLAFAKVIGDALVKGAPVS